MTNTAWATKIATVSSLAVCSSSPMPSNGMSAWLANALSIATAPRARYQNDNQPNNQPIFGLARRDAHWRDAQW
jgi:hypothetical protein